MSFFHYVWILSANVALFWYVRRKFGSLSRWITVPAAAVLYALNMTLCMNLNLTRTPSTLFMFFGIWYISNGYVSKRKLRRIVNMGEAQDETDALNTLQMAQGLIESGNEEAGIKALKSIIDFHPNTKASMTAKSLLTAQEMRN